MQDFIGSVCRSLVFKPSDAGGVFGGFVEKIGSIIRKPGIGLFSKPPVPALPPIAKSDAINVKKDDAFGRVYMGLKEKRHFKEKMQQQSKKDETKWKPLVRNRALKPSSLQLCMQMNEPDSNFGSKIWDPVGSDNTGSVNIWDYSDSEAAPASSWSTLPNRSLLCRPLPVDIGRCTCVIVKEALPEGLDGGNLYSLYTNTNKIRVELEEKQKQHARLLVLVLAIGVGVMKKMKEKDEQIQRMGKLNWVLQERVKSLYVENQLWRDLVKIERQRANAAHLELEKERLAAATAAEDIMAMILKLQNEKSLIEMEANQYRRLTKEKQLHDQGVIHSLRWIVMKHELERGLLEDQLKFFRSHLVAKLIFLDQLCEISQYLPRSSLEAHVPYPILRSIYSQYYANSPSTPLALLSASPRQSPAVSLSHASPLIRPRGDSTPQSIVTDSGYFKASSAHGQDQPYDTDSGSIGGVDNNKHRNVRRSGPLDYSMSRKVKFVEGSTSGSTGPSPLPRFAVSKSGPISYK